METGSVEVSIPRLKFGDQASIEYVKAQVPKVIAGKRQRTIAADLEREIRSALDELKLELEMSGESPLKVTDKLKQSVAYSIESRYPWEMSTPTNKTQRRKIRRLYKIRAPRSLGLELLNRAVALAINTANSQSTIVT